MSKISERGNFMANDFDKEYYVMNVDRANNHPLLSWGETAYDALRKKEIIDENTLTVPLRLIFGEPYPDEPYEVADFLSSGVQRIASGKFKNIFEGQIKYGIQFIPVEIKDNKGEIISGHYAFHIWNRLRVIDKNNYVGSAPNRFGNILRLEKFSLDPEILKNTTLEKRLVFGLDENNMIMIHQNVYEVLQAVNLTGLCFFRVDKWDDGVIPR